MRNPIGGNNYLNFFCAAFDSFGNFLWAKSPKEDYDTRVSNITTDINGNAYLIGRYAGVTISFDSTTLMNMYNGGGDIFIVKYDPSGNALWAKSIGGTDTDFGTGIATYRGSIYVAGMFWSKSINFGSFAMSAHYAPYGADDIYVGKLSGLCTGVSVIPKSENIFKLVGDVATFNVVASGSPIINYQWYRNGSPISGANSSSYTTPALMSYDDNSIYYCSVSNCSYSNTINTGIDSLSVCTGNSLNYQSLNKTLMPGDSATLFVNVTGTLPINYQWYKNGNPISGATDFVYVTPPVAASDSGSVYYCKIVNCKGLDTIQSYDIILNVSITGVIQIKQNIENELMIFPNPTHDKVTINSSQKILEVEITDLIGRLIYKAVMLEPMTSMVIESPGTYFISIRTKEGTTVRKIMKLD